MDDIKDGPYRGYVDAGVPRRVLRTIPDSSLESILPIRDTMIGVPQPWLNSKYVLKGLTDMLRFTTKVEWCMSVLASGGSYHVLVGKVWAPARLISDQELLLGTDLNSFVADIVVGRLLEAEEKALSQHLDENIVALSEPLC